MMVAMNVKMVMAVMVAMNMKTMGDVDGDFGDDDDNYDDDE